VKGPLGTRIWSYRDAPAVHLAVGALVCLFVLSPALFTPWGFGPDFTNHLWLVWQQGEAISNTGHPTLFLQQPGGVFEPFYGFYGGTLYAAVGAVSALFGNHAYPVYIASIGLAAAFAYGGMWWLGRQLGLSRWAAHLPGFVVVTAAYYLTDAYARGAWPELVALSAVPMFLAGGARLLAGPWKVAPVALFSLATIVLTGSHNLTLLWSALIIGPVAVVLWIVVGRERPAPRRIAMTAALTLVSVGVNAWFLVLDLTHSRDVKAWGQNEHFTDHAFRHYFYFDNLGNVLDPLRATPGLSTTSGLAIAAPVAALVLALILIAMGWSRRHEIGRLTRVVSVVVAAAMVALIVLMTMPASWWIWLGSPFTDIQFPYRLAGWLLIAIALLLAISLRLVPYLSPVRRQIAWILVGALVLVTVAQASAQMYASSRVDGDLNHDYHPRTVAFAGGPTTAPVTFYDPFSYADGSLRKVATEEARTVLIPVPEPGATHATYEGAVPPGKGPLPTNIAGGPYVVHVDGANVIGRTDGGAAVLEAPANEGGPFRVTVAADGGARQTLATILSLVCLLALLLLLFAMTIGARLRYRRDPAAT
jgi:hypothetical protein